MIFEAAFGGSCSAADFSRVAGAARERERERERYVGALNLNAMAPRGDGSVARPDAQVREREREREGEGGIPLWCAGWLPLSASVSAPPSKSALLTCA